MGIFTSLNTLGVQSGAKPPLEVRKPLHDRGKEDLSLKELPSRRA